MVDDICDASALNKEYAEKLEKWREAEYDLAAGQTVNAFYRQWVKNVHENIPYLTDEHNILNIKPHPKSVRSPAYVVAFGPSVKQIPKSVIVDKLPGRNIIAVNKSYPHLVEHGILPEWMCALEGSSDAPYEGLKGLDVSADPPKVVMSVCVHPAMVKWAEENAKEYYFFVPELTEKFCPGVSKVWAETFQIGIGGHGNNVGSMAVKLAVHPLLHDTIYLVGFDLSDALDPNWNAREISKYRFYYNPKRNETYAMTTVFEDYYEILFQNIEGAKKQYGTSFYNLCPRGPIPHREDIPTITWEDLP